MRISSSALGTYKARTGDVEPIVRYVRPRKAYKVAYIRMPGTTAKRVTASGVEIRQFDGKEMKVSCVLERVGQSDSHLYALTVSHPSNGPVWYRWKVGETWHNLLICVTDSEELELAVKNASDYFARLNIIARIAYQGNLSFEVADDVCQAVGNKLSLGYAALRLVRFERRASRTAKETRAIITRLATQNERREQVFSQLKIDNNPQTTTKVIAGALRALQFD